MFRIVYEGSVAKIFDESTDRIVATVHPEQTAAAKSLVQLANRAAEQAAEEAKKRTENAGQGG